MSSYINFYLRVNDNFAPIDSYSRSTELYQAISGNLPYEHIRAYTQADILEWIRTLEGQKERYEETKRQNEKRCSRVMEAKNTPLVEKIQYTEDIDDMNEELDRFIKEIEYTIHTLQIFRSMIDEYKWVDNEDSFKNDYNHYIYAGIEANGTLENVIDE